MLYFDSVKVLRSATHRKCPVCVLLICLHGCAQAPESGNSKIEQKTACSLPEGAAEALAQKGVLLLDPPAIRYLNTEEYWVDLWDKFYQKPLKAWARPESSNPDSSDRVDILIQPEAQTSSSFFWISEGEARSPWPMAHTQDGERLEGWLQEPNSLQRNFEGLTQEYRAWSRCVADRLLPGVQNVHKSEGMSIYNVDSDVLFAHRDGDEKSDILLSFIYTPLGPATWFEDSEDAVSQAPTVATGVERLYRRAQIYYGNRPGDWNSFAKEAADEASAELKAKILLLRAVGTRDVAERVPPSGFANTIPHWKAASPGKVLVVRADKMHGPPPTKLGQKRAVLVSFFARDEGCAQSNPGSPIPGD